MDQYLCKFCNNIFTYDEEHACFLCKNYDNVYKLPPQHELREKDAKNDNAKYGFRANSSDNSEKLCPLFQQCDDDISKKNESLPTKKNEDSFRCHLKKKRTFSSLSDGMLVEASHGNAHDYLHLSSTMNIRAKEGHSTENTFFKSPTENFEPRCIYASKSCVDYKRKSFAPKDVYAQNKFDPKPSTSKQGAFSEECQISLKESIFKSFTDSKKILMEFLGAAQTASLQSKNIPETVNVHASHAFSSGNKEEDKDMFEDLEDIIDTSIPNKVSPHILGKTERMSVNMKQPLDSLKELVSALAVPSGIHNDRLIEEKRQFTCDICHQRFVGKNQFEEHWRTHTVKKPFSCDSYDKAFLQKGSLKAHYHSQNGPKPYVCDICGKAFARKNGRNTHYRTHTGVKPYACGICKQAFTENSSLNRHCRKNTCEKPYESYIYKKAFAHESALDTHYRTHTGEKPYVCERCKKSFADRSSLRWHAKTHTTDES